MVSMASLLGTLNLWEVVEEQVGKFCLLYPWARNLTGRPTFMWKTGDPEMATPEQVRLTVQNIAIHRFLVNGG